MVANCLKPLLPLIISPKQMGYIEGIKILDGIILAHEFIHSIKVNSSPGMVLKLDLSRAFNKLRWDFIKNMLLSFWFSHEWTYWISSLVN